MTYKGHRGYQPQLGYLAEDGLCLTHEFRAGNVPAQSGMLKYCLLMELRRRVLAFC